MGPERAAVVRSRRVAAKQGFLMYYTKGVAIGTEVSVRYRESGRLSGVVVKRVRLYVIETRHIKGKTMGSECQSYPHKMCRLAAQGWACAELACSRSPNHYSIVLVWLQGTTTHRAGYRKLHVK